jgi:serine/threonine protein kinase/tetratricopeptide (TPR) repeat protein
LIDKRLGPYRITEEIGSGGMATVYRAYQPSMDRHVAIKVIRGHAFDDATLRDRFRREARLIARLEHPHLLPVYDFDGDHDPPYIVMRYLEGGTLRQVAAKGSLPFAEVLYTLGQVASALDYAHRQGVVHRDLKPSNVMIDKEGNAFVTDFGIARVSDAPEQLTGTGHLIGTPAYMSPEQARGLPDVDPAADRYALGVIAFELLTGATPYAHESSLALLMMHLNDPVPSARQRREDLPAAVDKVLAQALAKDRTTRPSSAALLVADLAKALKTRSTDAPTRLQSITQVLSLDQLKAFEERAKAPGKGTDAEAPSTPTPSDQQRQVTTLSFDAGGLGELVYEASGDEEAARARLDGLWKRFDEIVREGGGAIQARTNDIGVALWGRARTSEDDPERAIRSALHLREAALDFARTCLPAGWEPDEAEPLPFCIGITTGPVLLERDTQSGLYTASGAALMVASRVREAAIPGEILVAHDTFTQVRGVFSVHPHDPLRLRGRKEPLEVYVVKSAKPRAFRLKARGIEGVETRMVGRENELRVLQEALTLTVEDGETQVVTVVGEAGVGKSRLLYEFSNHLELIDQNVWLFEARATQPSMVQPFSLTRDLFSFRFQILDSDPIDVVRKKFVEGVAGFLGPGTAEQAHHLGQLVGFDFTSVPAIAEAVKDGEAFRRRGIELLGELFAAACRVYPIVLYIEDIHWADDRSLDLINVLVRENARLPLFVLCMARPSLYERRPQWGEGQRFHEKVQLEPLSQLSSRRLVRELLKKVPEVPPALRDLVVERADGNPFYIEELIRTLIDDGVIVKGEPHWSVDQTKLSVARIPPTLTGVLQSRLDTLPPGLQQMLQRASVLGRVFWDAAAVALSREAGLDEDEVHAVLEELRRRELVLRREESGFAGTVEYVFRHAILRDVTYETLAPRQRRALHRHAAEWLLAMGGERAHELNPLVAEHFERAGENGRAAARLLETGQGLLRSSSFAEALAVLGRARALLKDRKDDPAYPDVELRLAEGLGLSGSPAESTEVLLALLPLARARGRNDLVGRALGLLCRNAVWTNDLPSARRYIEEGLPIVRALGDVPELIFALRQAGNTHADFATSARYLEEAIELSRRSGDRFAEGSALNSLGNTYMISGDLGTAERHYRQALECATEAGHYRYLETMARSNLGLALLYGGDDAGAERELTQGRREARERGFRALENGNSGGLAWLALRRGDLALAERSLREVLAYHRDHSAVYPETVGLFGVLLGLRGDRRRGITLVGLARVRAPLETSEVRFLVDEFLPRLSEGVAAADVEAWLAEGAKLDFETEVATLASAVETAPTS